MSAHTTEPAPTETPATPDEARYVPLGTAVRALLRKELALEMRAPQAVPAMALFSVTTLVVFHFALQRGQVEGDLASGVLWVTLLFAAALLPLFYASSSGFIDDATTALAFVVMALGLNVVVGFAGLLDLGYVAFYAIGAYTVGWFASAFIVLNMLADIGSIISNPRLRHPR